MRGLLAITVLVLSVPAYAEVLTRAENERRVQPEPQPAPTHREADLAAAAAPAFAAPNFDTPESVS